MDLTHFTIIGLHGVKTISVPINDNKLVLVGENGSGKSTVVNLIYFFMTRQWDRLSEYRFSALEATVNGELFAVTAEQIEQYGSSRRLVRYPQGMQKRALRALAALDPKRVQTMASSLDQLRQFARENDLPLSMVGQMLESYLHGDESSIIPELDHRLAGIVQERFLYLPTYRRIEHDLQAIFRKKEVDIEAIQGAAAGSGSDAYVELVHFGMQDVEQKIQDRLSETRENLTSALNKLTGTYLRDIIQGKHQEVSLEDIQGLDSNTVDAILARIPDETLPPLYKSILKNRVGMFAGSFQESDTVVAHFMLQLRTLYEEQRKTEESVRDFVDVSNQYLIGKKVVYDDKAQTIQVRLDSGSRPAGRDTIELRMLSSGEKQIVSLFSHLFLSTEGRYFVVIDEPELSLSVPWQRRFLPDVLRSRRVGGLIAVTHSPFIWQNELEGHVRSLTELTVQYQ